MATGLRIRAPDGRVRLDLTMRVARILGQMSIGGAGTAQSGSISVPRFAEGEPFVFTMLGAFPDSDGNAPTIAASGTTLSWQYRSAGSTAYERPVVSILYGVF